MTKSNGIIRVFRTCCAAGRTTVTWTQSGHTCVIDSPSSVPEARLVALAS